MGGVRSADKCVMVGRGVQGWYIIELFIYVKYLQKYSSNFLSSVLFSKVKFTYTGTYAYNIVNNLLPT